jgi:16S rRNA (uracil1498-N3)-methyltransferase
MPFRRFFLSGPPVDSKAVLRGDEAHHLAHVLRAEAGSVVELIDGSGRVWLGTVHEVGGDYVELEKVEPVVQGYAAAPHIALIQSLCRADKLEWILQKTTELGISEIYLLKATRSVTRIPEVRVENRMHRWQRIILAAAKQSRRNTLPVLHPPAQADTICVAAKADLKLVFSESEPTSSLKRILRESAVNSAVFSIGPEGGWTVEEEEFFLRAGFRPASLGAAILRTETAAIVATALLKYELEKLVF